MVALDTINRTTIHKIVICVAYPFTMIHRNNTPFITFLLSSHFSVEIRSEKYLYLPKKLAVLKQILN